MHRNVKTRGRQYTKQKLKVKISISVLSLSPFHIYFLRLIYLQLRLSLTGLSYFLSLVKDKIRPCRQPGLASAVLKILFTALQLSKRPLQSHRRRCRAAAASDIRRAAGTGKQLWLEPFVFQMLSERGSVCSSLLLCYWKDRPYTVCLFMHWKIKKPRYSRIKNMHNLQKKNHNNIGENHSTQKSFNR